LLYTNTGIKYKRLDKQEGKMRQITENVRLLGNGYFNYFLVGDQQAALIECGTRGSAAILAKELEQVNPRPNVRYLVALHSHFDHACGIPALKRLFPQALTAASVMGKKLLSKEKIVKNLFENDEQLSKTYLQNGFIDRMPEVPAPAT
jgi:glyoxylase-like metal-dependent hydrolase (beta-lactamase superfamily II)